MSRYDPLAAVETVIAAAREAGQLVLCMQQDGLRNVRGKSTQIDLVTEADVASEQLLRTRLGESYPQIGFWGEETNRQPADDYFWVVDPIDGTTNFASGLPFFAVNVALNHRATTLLGVTLDAPGGRIYWAALGHGAYVRAADGSERRLSVNQADDLNAALISTGFPYHRAERADNNGPEFLYFMARARGVRCMGSAALDLANVASGALAAYWEGFLQPWDAAPGVLLVREAGGQVTDYSGAPWSLTSPSLVASNGQSALHTQLLQGIQSARNGLSDSLLERNVSSGG